MVNPFHKTYVDFIYSFENLLKVFFLVLNQPTAPLRNHFGKHFSDNFFNGSIKPDDIFFSVCSDFPSTLPKSPNNIIPPPYAQYSRIFVLFQFKIMGTFLCSGKKKKYQTAHTKKNYTFQFCSLLVCGSYRERSFRQFVLFNLAVCSFSLASKQMLCMGKELFSSSSHNGPFLVQQKCSADKSARSQICLAKAMKTQKPSSTCGGERKIENAVFCQAKEFPCIEDAFNRAECTELSPFSQKHICWA